MSSTTYPGTPLEAQAEFPYALNFASHMLAAAGWVFNVLAEPFTSSATPRISTVNRHSLEDIGLNRDEIFLGHAETFWRI